MSMLTSQILKFLDSPKTQKSKYLKNKILFFFKENKIMHYKCKATAKNNFLSSRGIL